MQNLMKLTFLHIWLNTYLAVEQQLPLCAVLPQFSPLSEQHWLVEEVDSSSTNPVIKTDFINALEDVQTQLQTSSVMSGQHIFPLHNLK